jgi:V8-like Glu-specific endopeptidase
VSATIDTSPYPWVRRDAQDLHLVLCEMYPTPKGAAFMAQKAGLNVAMLNVEQSAFLLWKEILETSAGAQKTRKLVELASEQNPDSPRKPFLDSLLQANPKAIDRQPRTADGTPVFLVSNDHVTEKEALLFHDDLTLPVGRVSWLIAALQRLLELAPAVCRLEVVVPGDSQRATAFRIGSDLLLTNWHALHFGQVAAAQVTAEFGFEDDGKGGTKATTAIACDVASMAGDAADDWCVIRTAAPIAATIPLIPLSAAADPVLNAPAFIIQHPGGEKKRVAYTRNQITGFDDRIVHYLSDTQYGSSGAPVLDDSGKIVALHRAGGRPQEVAGKPPVKKNEGIRIARVTAGLTAAGIAFQ